MLRDRYVKSPYNKYLKIDYESQSSSYEKETFQVKFNHIRTFITINEVIIWKFLVD